VGGPGAGRNWGHDAEGPRVRRADTCHDVAAGLPAAVIALQRTAGNRAVARAVRRLQRVVLADPVTAGVSDRMAQQMTDEELSEQAARVREALGVAVDEAVSRSLQANLRVLEAEERRRQPAPAAPRAGPELVEREPLTVDTDAAGRGATLHWHGRGHEITVAIDVRTPEVGGRPFAYEYLPGGLDRPQPIIRIVAAPGVAIRPSGFTPDAVLGRFGPDAPRLDVFRVQDPAEVPIQGESIDPARYESAARQGALLVQRRPDGVDIAGERSGAALSIRVDPWRADQRLAWQVRADALGRTQEITVVRTPGVQVRLSGVMPDRSMPADIPLVGLRQVPRVTDFPDAGGALQSLGRSVALDIEIERDPEMDRMLALVSLTPIVGEAFAVAEFVYGVTTGHDFWHGHRLSATDKALLGLGAVLSVLPAGAAVAREAGVFARLGGARAARVAEAAATLSGEDRALAVRLAADVREGRMLTRAEQDSARRLLGSLESHPLGSGPSRINTGQGTFPWYSGQSNVAGQNAWRFNVYPTERFNCPFVTVASLSPIRVSSSRVAELTNRMEGMLARNQIPALMREMGISEVEHWFRSRREMEAFIRGLRPGQRFAMASPVRGQAIGHVVAGERTRLGFVIRDFQPQRPVTVRGFPSWVPEARPGRGYLIMVVGEERGAAGAAGSATTGTGAAAIGAGPRGTGSWSWLRGVGEAAPRPGDHIGPISRLAEETRGLTDAERAAAWDVLADLHAALSGDLEAQRRLFGRNLHQLPAGVREGASSNFRNWWSVDLTGRQNPNRFIFEVNADGSINWRIRDTHAG
jgi:hypothetical protein